ncbi:phosphohistidine phosphatase [Rhizobium petrolearium]|uniref:SixA phosphatase family protein n=1 Tax=Neorhizobium petrolearium TaxID=515361 RepID=UPI001AE41A5C|nr:histidine phosphatase family protein [Neorhizobium petrolearium]MBP1846084.1 phosphohistidine phosphatase [Neorhizobium petrolearium]
MTTITPPPSRIYLLRHAKSGWAEPGQHDFDRALDNQGFAEAEVVADKAADRNYRPDIVISSTAVRCRQTAEAVRRATDEEIEPIYIDELYNGSLGTYMAVIEGQKESASVMLIGHNPTMEEVLEALIGADQMVAAIPGGYPPAGLAVLDYRGIVAGSGAAWVLIDFLTA